MQEMDTQDLDRRTKARIVKAAVTPRPIAWVSTVDGEGNENLAPFSSYNYVNLTRPVVEFNSTVGADGEMKDTVRNALDTEEFAVNIVTANMLEQMDHTAASIPPDDSEFDLAEIERAPCVKISPPRVADAPVTMECTLHDAIEVYDSLMVLGKVEYIHVSSDVLTDGQIDSRKLDTVGRLGGPYYTISEPVPFERQF